MTSYWQPFILADYPFTDQPIGACVVDVGCGSGSQVADLVAKGCNVIGIEPDQASLESGRSLGLDIRPGTAEHLPLPDESADAVVCKVVLPYTDERKAIGELARVLRPGGVLNACYHGSGYYLRYLVAGDSFPHRVYGARSVVNSWWYALSGRRIAGWLGDTIYQSSARLARHYRDAGLTLESRVEGPRFMGLPVFIYDRVRKPMRRA